MQTAAWILLAALAQDEARLREGEARYRAAEARSTCRGILAYLDGVSGVNYAGSGTDYRLVLVVRDPATQRAARDLLRGDACDGVKILWCISNPAAAPAWTPPPPPAPLAAPVIRPPALAAAPAVRPPPAPCAPAETRRTFFAGPVTLTPPRRYDTYARYANCSPSRYGLLVGGCPPRPCPTSSAHAGPPAAMPRPSCARPVAAVCYRPGRCR